MDNILKYVTENALILIPVLYILGAMLKNLQSVEDRYIPFYTACIWYTILDSHARFQRR